MRWKIEVLRSDGESYDTWSLDYPTNKSARAAMARLNTVFAGRYRYRVARMTPEDEVLANELERSQ